MEITIEQARNICGQLCFYVAVHGGEGNPFKSMKWDWFADLAAPQLVELAKILAPSASPSEPRPEQDAPIEHGCNAPSPEGIADRDRASNATCAEPRRDEREALWISVEKRLPEIGVEVIAWKPDRGCQIVIYSNESHKHRTIIRRDGQWWDSGHRITHWMKLPNFPDDCGEIPESSTAGLAPSGPRISASLAELKAARDDWHEHHGVPIHEKYVRFLNAIGDVHDALERLSGLGLGEREQFEKWLTSFGKYAPETINVLWTGSGYSLPEIQSMWEAWQASRASAALPQTANEILQTLKFAKEVIDDQVARFHKDCRCQLCESLPDFLQRAIELLESSEIAAVPQPSAGHSAKDVLVILDQWGEGQAAAIVRRELENLPSAGQTEGK